MPKRVRHLAPQASGRKQSAIQHHFVFELLLLQFCELLFKWHNLSSFSSLPIIFLSACASDLFLLAVATYRIRHSSKRLASAAVLTRLFSYSVQLCGLSAIYANLSIFDDSADLSSLTH